MATNDGINNPLAGNEGTGKYVGDQSPSLTTPDIGAATATSLDIGSTVVVDSTLDDDSFATATNTSIATSESIKAYVDAQVAAGGQVVQYVVATDTTDDTSTSQTLANSSLTASITPTSATNRIVVISNAYVTFTTGSAATNYSVTTDLYRTTGTPATIQGSFGNGIVFGSNVTGANTLHVNTMIGTEIAGDTNLHTYYLRFARLASSGTATCHGASGKTKIMIILELLV